MRTTHSTNISVKLSESGAKNPVESHDPTELARRSSSGIEVGLFWERNEGVDSVLVRVRDRDTGVLFEIAAEPQLAMELYHHPFAYRDLAHRQRAVPDKPQPEERRRRG